MVCGFTPEVTAPAASGALTVLGEEPAQFSVLIVRADSQQVTLAPAPPLRPGALVKLENANGLWLGQVQSCTPGAEAAIRVEHFLKDLSSLAELLERFHGRRA